VKIIRNKQTGHSEGYGFIEFYSQAAAEHTLMNFNGQMMPNIEMAFKLNWASASTGDKRGDNGSDHAIFVGDLAPDVTDSMLEDVFRANYPSVRGAKVVVDRITGRPKGYGFVHFGDLNEQARAMTEMNGMMLSTRKMRIGAAASKKNTDAQQTYATNGLCLWNIFPLVLKNIFYCFILACLGSCRVLIIGASKCISVS
jgi:RNA recognition motif-containing protein